MLAFHPRNHDFTCQEYPSGNRYVASFLPKATLSSPFPAWISFLRSPELLTIRAHGRAPLRLGV
ncbi:MAG: hypothetical protein A2Z14_18055 [Chloroflexi bacterium RBG_16_48_8]|nr:MAG: hypothetical protein A2Z14_18055 [Chloroflexi bacterium RBG_16_48_8]